MKRLVTAVSVFAFCVSSFPVAGQGPPPASQPGGVATRPADATTQPADAVAVTVDGHAILESEVERQFRAFVEQRSRGRELPPAVVNDARVRLRPQILDSLIEQYLLDEEVKDEKITVSDKEFADEVEQDLRNYMLRTGTTREKVEEQIRAQEGISLSEFLSQAAGKSEFRRQVLHARLLAKERPDEVKVTPEEIKSRYERDLTQVYSKPAEVRASHILIPAAEVATPEEKSSARKTAESVLIEAKKPGADFAVLAGQHSSCPSKAKGGDLGFFPRQGAMVEPFAAAAFALKPGEISGVVETRFGFHVIKVTEIKPEQLVTLEQATDSIREQLELEKTAEAKTRLAAELRKHAEIVFASGKDKAPPVTP